MSPDHEPLPVLSAIPFAYVTRDDGIVAPLVLDSIRQATLLGTHCDVLAALAEDLVAAGCDPGRVIRIEVETGVGNDEDGLPDPDEPDTAVVYARAPRPLRRSGGK